MEILQTWIDADQELESGNSEQAQAMQEMAIWVAEQTAENAKAASQGVPAVQTQTAGTMSDKAAQQTILSVFKSVLSMQSMECHSVSGQLMAAGATEEDVKPDHGTHNAAAGSRDHAFRTRPRGAQAPV